MLTSELVPTLFRDLRLATGETPRYLQIVHAVLRMVMRGEIGPQEVLPSAPAVATHISVSIGTVTKAYGKLQEQAVVTVREGRGTFLTDGCREIARVMLESLAMRELAHVALDSRLLGWDDAEVLRRVHTMRETTLCSTGASA